MPMRSAGSGLTACHQMSAQTETKSGKTMRIKDVRQGLHTLVHTQGLDGLLHLYQRLEKRGRALLLCLLCAEAGWLILSCACFCECNSQPPRTKMGEVSDVPIADEATPDGNDSLYCFNFLTQRGNR